MTQAAQVVEAIAFFIAFVLTQPCVHALNGPRRVAASSLPRA